MNNSIQEATESSLKCIVQAMLREGIVNVDERDRFLKLLCEEGVAI